MRRIKDTQQDQSSSPCNREDDTKPAKNLLGQTQILRQSAGMAQPTFRGKAEVEKDGGDDTACDEERLETRRADVANVGDVLLRLHRGIFWAALGQPDDEHGQEHCYEASAIGEASALLPTYQPTWLR